MENEFGTSNDDEVILKILEAGEVQEHEVRTDSIFPVQALLLSEDSVWGSVGKDLLTGE